MQHPDDKTHEHQASSTDPENSCPEAEGINLLDFLLAVVRHKRMIARTTFGSALVAIIYSLLLPNIYTAKTMIMPGDDNSKGLMSAMMAQMGSMAGLAGDIMGGKTKADLYVTVLKSESIKDAMIDRFKLLDVYDEEYRMNAYKRLDKITKITTGKKDGVITLEVDDKDPKRAADMANTYISELGKLTAALDMTDASNNRRFLEKRITEARADLVKSEGALKNFQVKNKAISVGDQARATIEGVAQLRAQLAVLEVQLATLRQQFTDSSQEVKNAKASIGNIRAQISRMEGKGGESSSIPNIGNLPDLGQEYIRLMREYKIQEAVVEMLTKQYEMASLSETRDVSPLQVIQVAKPPERKSKPFRAQIVIFITFLSFFLSTGYVYTKESFTRMSEENTVRWKMLLNELPHLRKTKN